MQTRKPFSSPESKYVALSGCAKQLSWMHKLLREFIYKLPWGEGKHFETSKIYIDSASAISLAKNKQNSTKSKRIEIKFIR